jgi:transposase
MIEPSNLFGKCTDCDLLTLRQELIAYKAEAHSLRALRVKDAELIKKLEDELVETKAKLRYSIDQRYGKKNEQQGSKKTEGQLKNDELSPKKRGRQPNSKAPKRRSMDNMPQITESALVPDLLRTCQCCGLPLHPMPPEQVKVKEIKVNAYVRVINKERLVKSCKCPETPSIVTAPAVGPLFSGSNLGVSTCCELLMGRFHDGLPMHRVLERLSTYGLDLASGTVHSLIPNFLSLLSPVSKAIIARNREASHWHADETTHRVFVDVPGKVGHRWYLWVFAAHDTTIFMMRKNRSADAIRDHLGPDAAGIISADRAKMYISYASENKNIKIAFCWVHVKRDFLKIAIEYPELKPWTDMWVDRISELFHLNKIRSIENNETLLREAVAKFETQWKEELAVAKEHTPQKKVLNSLKFHWTGLTIFLDHPEIPMENNKAELAIRWEVIARKSIYGCRSLNSAKLLETMATITVTLEQNKLSVRDWLMSYLMACAQNGGKPPADISNWLPWNKKASDHPAVA